MHPMAHDAKALVLQAIDIVDLVTQTVALKRIGRRYTGLCPFHQEKTPSFSVNPEKQYFYCFGCKESGNAIDFVIKRDRVEFKEALELLARQAGIELPSFGGQSTKPGERQLLLDACSAACRFFENQLSLPQGQAARDYLAKRGFTTETLQRFQVGFAPEGWDNLLRSPLLKKFPPPLLATAGLLKTREGGGHYDVFRNRIIFPIRNEQGQVIAFGGRIMPGATDPAKYLNSPETPLFVKSKTAFGLDLGRQRIVETRTVAVVEGYTDVMMAHQFAATNVIAPLGTALTEQHVSILKRFADKVVLLFDGDAAGGSAADRVLELFLTQPIEIAVASLPDGLDPDEFFLKHGREAFDELLLNAVDALEYAWRQLSAGLEPKNLTSLEQSTRKYLQILGSAARGKTDSLRYSLAMTRLNKLSGIPIEELNRLAKASAVVNRRPAATIQPAANVSPPSAVEKGEPDRAEPGQMKAERQILGVLLVEPKRWHDVQLALDVNDFGVTKLRRLAEFYWDHQRHEGEPVFSEFLAQVPEPSMARLAIELVEEIENLPDPQVTLEGALAYMQEVRLRKQERETVVAGNLAQNDAQGIDALRQLQEQRRRPDIRRVGS
jgi:DNA primase